MKSKRCSKVEFDLKFKVIQKGKHWKKAKLGKTLSKS